MKRSNSGSSRDARAAANMEHAHGGHRPDRGVRQMNPSFQFSTGADDSFEVLWEDGEHVFGRRWENGADGCQRADLAVLSAAEHPTPDSVTRLTHEYGLKDDL